MDLMLVKFIIAENITFPIIIYYYCCDNPACSKTFKKMNDNGEVWLSILSTSECGTAQFEFTQMLCQSGERERCGLDCWWDGIPQTATPKIAQVCFNKS